MRLTILKQDGKGHLAVWTSTHTVPGQDIVFSLTGMVRDGQSNKLIQRARKKARRLGIPHIVNLD